jgi:hypothetical protein
MAGPVEHAPLVVLVGIQRHPGHSTPCILLPPCFRCKLSLGKMYELIRETSLYHVHFRAREPAAPAWVVQSIAKDRLKRVLRVNIVLPSVPLSKDGGGMVLIHPGLILHW